MEYCNFIFNSGKKLKCEKVDKIQSKCLRIIENCGTKVERQDEKILCVKYNICTLQQRRDMQLCSIMYRYSRIEDYIDSTITRENLRSEKKINFKCPFTKIVKIRKSPFYRGVDLWNSLKVEHHRAENKKRFKSLLSKTLL